MSDVKDLMEQELEDNKLVADEDEELNDDEQEGLEDTSEEENEDDPEAAEASEAALAAKLEGLEKAYEEPEKETPRAGLERLRAEYQAKLDAISQSYQENKPPEGGIYQRNGLSVYQMDESQLNEYLDDLKDNGRQMEAARIEQAIFNKERLERALLGEAKNLEQERGNLEVLEQEIQWVEVEQEWLAEYPEVKPYLGAVKEHLQRKMGLSQAFAASTESKGGKNKAVYQALKDVGALEDLRKKLSKSKLDGPSAPDVNAGSKKASVKAVAERAFTREEIDKMTPEQYKANRSAILKQLNNGLIK